MSNLRIPMREWLSDRRVRQEFHRLLVKEMKQSNAWDKQTIKEWRALSRWQLIQDIKYVLTKSNWW
jgi:hypothetical protein